MSEDSLRIALLLGTKSLPKWFVQALETITNTDGIEVSLITYADRPDDDVSLFADIRRKRSWTLIAALQKIYEVTIKPPSLNNDQDLEDIPSLDGVPIHQTTVEPSPDLGYEFQTSTINKIQEEAEIAIHYGIGILQGDILNAPKYGVIGFHHGDLRECRGGPPGFWEYIHDYSKTGVTVQRYTETLDGGEILAFEPIPINDDDTWKEVRLRQRSISRLLLAQAVKNLLDPEFKAEAPNQLGPIYSTDQRDWQTTFRYIHRELKGRTKKFLRV